MKEVGIRRSLDISANPTIIGASSFNWFQGRGRGDPCRGRKKSTWDYELIRPKELSKGLEADFGCQDGW